MWHGMGSWSSARHTLSNQNTNQPALCVFFCCFFCSVFRVHSVPVQWRSSEAIEVHWHAAALTLYLVCARARAIERFGSCVLFGRKIQIYWKLLIYCSLNIMECGYPRADADSFVRTTNICFCYRIDFECFFSSCAHTTRCSRTHVILTHFTNCDSEWICIKKKVSCSEEP